MVVFFLAQHRRTNSRRASSGTTGREAAFFCRCCTRNRDDISSFDDDDDDDEVDDDDDVRKHNNKNVMLCKEGKSQSVVVGKSESRKVARLRVFVSPRLLLSRKSSSSSRFSAALLSLCARASGVHTHAKRGVCVYQ